MLDRFIGLLFQGLRQNGLRRPIFAQPRDLVHWPPSPRDRQRYDIIAMADLPANDVIDDLEIETRGRSDPADGAERSAEQHRSFRQMVTAGIAVDQVFRRQHLVQRAFLVELPVTVGGDKRAQINLSQ